MCFSLDLTAPVQVRGIMQTMCSALLRPYSTVPFHQSVSVDVGHAVGRQAALRQQVESRCWALILSRLCICAGEAGLDRDDISAKQHDTMSERSGRAMSDDLMLEDDAMPSGSLDF